MTRLQRKTGRMWRKKYCFWSHVHIMSDTLRIFQNTNSSSKYPFIITSFSYTLAAYLLYTIAGCFDSLYPFGTFVESASQGVRVAPSLSLVKVKPTLRSRAKDAGFCSQNSVLKNLAKSAIDTRHATSFSISVSRASPLTDMQSVLAS